MSKQEKTDANIKKCDVCGGKLATGIAMYAGRRHWECHEGQGRFDSTREVFDEMKRLINEDIKKLCEEDV